MKAAEAGNATAQFNVGRAFQQGVGVREDTIHARYWYERADAVQAAAGRPKNREKREPGFLRAAMPRLPESCKPSFPPRLAMRQSNVTEVTGLIALYIDSEGRVRGVTERNISVEALKFDAVALFSASLRSKECAIPDEARDVKIEIPFKFVLR